MSTQPQPSIIVNAKAIDPVWLLAPKFAMVRDLPYPPPVVKQF